MNPNLLLFNAARAGNVANFKRVLEENPELDINWQNPSHSNRTSLHMAAENGHHEIVKILLAHPQIDVNSLNGEEGSTALSRACENGKVEVIRLLCEDPRVDVNLTANISGYVPLFKTIYWNKLQALKWLIALRGEDLDMNKKAATNGGNWKTLLEIARDVDFPDITSLLERFAANPPSTNPV